MHKLCEGGPAGDKPAGMCEPGECPTRILGVSAEIKTEQTQIETQLPISHVRSLYLFV